MAINISNLPSNPSVAESRYRLVVAATGEARGKQVPGEMVLLDPTGNAVWRGNINSGGKRDFLPGLTSDLGRGITAEYPIGWDNISTNRTDELGREGMSYSNGAAGYFIPINNPRNLGELGGAGRNAFGIHPNGVDNSTSGCLGFVDTNGKLSSASDRVAREFYQTMMNIPASQRPKALEVINPKVARSGAVSAAVSRNQDVPAASSDADREQDERRRRDTQRDGDAVSDMGSAISDAILSLFKSLLPDWLYKFIFEKDENAPNEREEDVPEASSGEKISQARAVYNSGAVRKWEAAQKDYTGGAVIHGSPVAGASRTSGYGMRMHPIDGVRKMHTGDDITGGGDIRASADGIVLFAGRKGGYGNTVIIGHEDGTKTLYAHMTGAKMPAIGEPVDKGEVIGVMGSTGKSTGVHLHYEQFDKSGKHRRPVIDGVAESKEHDHADHKESPARVAGSTLRAAGASLSTVGESTSSLDNLSVLGVGRLNTVQRS